jgi:hypothetical protein
MRAAEDYNLFGESAAALLNPERWPDGGGIDMLTLRRRAPQPLRVQ